MCERRNVTNRCDSSDSQIRVMCGSSKQNRPSVNSAKLQGKDICEYRDLKLKDAEKTIANKDVIIKMLQDQVKKLQESYKQNMKETENFRYKFCLASEQMKRLRDSLNKVSPTLCEKQDANKCTNNPRPIANGNFSQQFQNIEKMMTNHHELLRSLMDKIEKNTNQPSLDEISREYKSKISLLHKDIKRLQEENSELHEQLMPQSFSAAQVRDSLINAYKRTTEELQKKLSSSELNSRKDKGSSEEVVTDSVDLDSLTAKRVSFHEKSGSDNIENNGEGLDSRESRVNFCRVKEEEEEEEKKGVENVDVDTKNCIDELRIKQSSQQNLNHVNEKLKDVGDRIIELLNQQTRTNEELSTLREEMGVFCNTTKICTENFSKLQTNIDKQLETFLNKFEEHKAISDDLTRANEIIRTDLADLKTNIKNLVQNFDKLKDKQITVNHESHNFKNNISKESDVQIGNENPACMIYGIREYVEKVKSENIKLKSTISSVIDRLNHKIVELKRNENQKQSTITFSKYVPKLPDNEDSKKKRTCHPSPGLEIEDIYNAVRKIIPSKNPTITDSSVSCFYQKKCNNSPSLNFHPHENLECCHMDPQLTQNNTIEDIYTSVLCACKTGSYKTTPCESLSGLPSSSNITKSETKKGLEPMSRGDTDCESSHCLLSSLETYVEYLHEQLRAITSIENKIECIKEDIKEK